MYVCMYVNVKHFQITKQNYYLGLKKEVKERKKTERDSREKGEENENRDFFFFLAR